MQRKEELAHTRQEIISTNINHYLKNKNMHKDELFSNVSNNIKNIFALDEGLFDKTIDHMIKMDYIKISENMLQKIYY